MSEIDLASLSFGYRTESQDFTLVQLIKGRWQNQPVLVKSFIKPLSSEKLFKNEVGFYRNFSQLPEVHKFFGSCETDFSSLIVLDGSYQFTLDEVVLDKNRIISIPIILDFCMSICKGMCSLHQKDIIHRDLRPKNILILSLEHRQLQITNFTFSKYFGSQDVDLSINPSTAAYAAPEILKADHDMKVDVYSFSIIVWQLFSRGIPWPVDHFTDVIIRKVRKGKRPSPHSSLCPPSFIELIERCWAGTSSKRPPFNDIRDELEVIMKKELTPKTLRGSGSSPTQPPRVINASSSLVVSPIYSPPIISPVHSPSMSPLPRSTTTSPISSRIPRTSSPSPSPFTISPPAPPPYDLPPSYSQLILPLSSSSDPLISSVPATLSADQQFVSSLNHMNPISFSSFSNSCQQYLKADPSDIKLLEFLFNVNGGMPKEHFTSFVERFSPFIKETGSNGYKISEISEFLSLPYFHGFLKSTESKEMLTQHEIGTFMLRFSFQRGGYSLDIKTEGDVSHWLIDKVEKFGVRIYDKKFESLEALVNHYSTNKLLKSTGVHAGYLSWPLVRADW